MTKQVKYMRIFKTLMWKRISVMERGYNNAESYSWGDKIFEKI